jgi:asparagine synthetase B (glutamine-hydrolysing)
VTPTWESRFHKPDRIELATGLVTAMTDRPDLVAECGRDLAPGSTARGVLEELMLRALERPPCVISFSGGRDSSSLLALGTHLAHREGLPMPVAFTFRYDNEAEADETPWQELVIRHVGVSDWEKAHVGTRNDVVGEVAQAFLLSHGLVYPPTIFNDTLPLMRASGGTHISGEGGDEIFGVRRSTLLRRILDNPKYLAKRRHLAYAALCLGPRKSRVAAWRRELRQQLNDALTFVRIEVREHVCRDLAWHLAQEPFNHTSSLGWHLRRKMIVMSQEALTAFSNEHNVLHLDPFLEPRFVAAYARMVRPYGLATRRDAMRALFADILPDEILTRSSKAMFNRGFLTDVGRAFAKSWEGAGIETDIIDGEALRSAWLSTWPPAQSFGLLQSAWLAQNLTASTVAP